MKINGTILVDKDIKAVFDFFANPSNDKLWRTEINQSLLNGELKLGARVAEYSKLSKKVPNHLVELECVQFENNSLAVFETGNNAPFYLKSHREVRAITPGRTEIIYKLDFDLAIIKFALGFSLPVFIVSLKANRDMRKYLRQLDRQLAKVSSNPGH